MKLYTFVFRLGEGKQKYRFPSEMKSQIIK